MKIVCPTCNAVYNIPDQKIPANKSVATCKNCGGKIVFEPGVGVMAERATSSVATTSPPPALDTASAAQGSRSFGITTPADRNKLTPSISKSRFERTSAASSPPPEAGPFTLSAAATGAEEAASKAIALEFSELGNLGIQKYRLDQIFSANKDGSFKNRKNKLKVKIMVAVDSVLSKVVKEDETILRIGRGTAYYLAEILFGNGVLTTIYNTYAIVCTNRRILFINVTSRLKRPTHYVFQMFYSEVKKIGRGPFFNALVLDRLSGKRRTFTGVGLYHSRDLKRFILDRKASAAPVESSVLPGEDLCPACYVPLQKGLTSCPSCKVDFSKPRKALFKSLLLPGLGDIYLGHRALGVLELLTSLLVWILVGSMVLSQEPDKLISAAVLLVLYNGIDGLVTYHMAKKGYMLEKSHS